MRRLSMLTCFLASTGMMVPVFALAEDAGTYRPGQTYHTVTASSPMQCAAQCQGDAQCKGWNFVRPRQISRTGICEFNAQKVSPVPSAVSISGDNATARSSHRIISGGTNTVRVGTPSQQAYAQPSYAPQPQLPTPSQTNAGRMTAQQASQRSLPTRPVSPQKPAYQMQAAAQPHAPMRIEHNLGDPTYRGRNTVPQMAQPSVAQPSMIQRAPGQTTQRSAGIPLLPTPTAQQQAPVPPYMRIQHHLDDGMASAAYQAGPRPQQQSQRQPYMQQAAPVVMRHHLDGGAPQYQARREMVSAPQPIEQRKPQPQEEFAQKAPPQDQPIASLAGAPTSSAPQITRFPNPGATAQARTGLYGSLYDDVQRDGVTAPLALTKQNTPTNPDVPIATVRYIPTAPVSTASLPVPYGR